MKRGYSILEVLVAVALLSIALPGLVKWVTASRRSQNESFRSEQATEFAQYVLDSLRDMPRDTRTEKPSGIVLSKNGTSYTLVWKYLASPPFSGKIPGAVSLDVIWAAGKIKRTSHLDGVLP